MIRQKNLSPQPVGSTLVTAEPEPVAAQPELRQKDVEISAREKAIALFHRTYSTVRGYRDFVDKSGVDISTIQRADDFERIPIMTKEYIYQYPLEDRLLDGRTMANCYMMTATTGSTGKPILWPRDYQGDQALIGAFERLYRECFQIDQRKTLHIIQNFLSTTPGGMVMSQLSWAASADHQMTTITPGVDLDRAILMIEEMGPSYDQIIISTYPPYLKAFLDRADEVGLTLANYCIKFVSTGEKFSEQFRDHVVSRLGNRAVREDIISLYGCTEAGLVGAETPFSIALAQAAVDSSELADHLFGTTEIPNIMAYNPMSKYVETVGASPQFQEILITAEQPAPLIRFNIHDRGGILLGSDIQQTIRDHNLFLSMPADDARFVYVFGRSDSVFLRAAAVYIEEIRYCLENSRFSQRFTGEFQYGSKTDAQFEEELNVVVHLQQNCTLTSAEQDEFHQEFWDNLRVINPTLLLFDEAMLHAGMLKISFGNGSNQIERFGKYKYFL